MQQHLTLAVYSLIVTLVSGEDKTTFENGFGSWIVENGTWIITSWKEISKRNGFTAVPDPPAQTITESDTSVGTGQLPQDRSAKVAIPTLAERNSSSFQESAAMMHLDLNVTANSSLEVLFTCLVFGWSNMDRSTSFVVNPGLQVMYDDVPVFNVENAIENLTSDYSVNEWNQFRLYSSYGGNISMRITFLATPGTSAESLVAVDNIIVRMDNATTSSSISSSEPEADIGDENSGSWKLIETASEEEESLAEKSIVSAKPEFCDLMPEIGPCKDNWPRFYYNASIDDCAQFYYGGCDGNENNFHSLFACRAVCKKPNQTEEDLIFQLIFGNFNRGLSMAAGEHFTELELDFEDSNFEDWHVNHWSIVRLDSDNIFPFSSEDHSKVAATPDHHIAFIGRPRLSHPIRLIPNSTITFQFSLLLTGNINPKLMPFFETLNPGFKIYIGDFLFFDYFVDNPDHIMDKNWHNFSKSESTNKILNFPGMSNNGSKTQMVKIEAWRGGDQSSVLLDDLHIFQSSANGSGEKEDANWPFPCNLTKSVGPCIESLHRFYFDFIDGRCKPFVFGGCRGNANNFLTLQDCNDKCGPRSNSPEHRCILPRDEGTCDDFTERFYFDSTQAKCLAFIFKGCSGDAGDANNFLTMAECESECRSFINGSLSSVTAFPRMTSDCHRKIDRGSCSSPIQMWAFDEDRGRCVPFTYGGCGGNQNRFFTRAVCSQTCEEALATQDTTTMTTAPTRYIVKTKSSCKKPRVGASVTCANGVNLSKFYYYDQDANACEAEIGCPVPMNDTSVGNRFFSKAACVKLCQQPFGTTKHSRNSGSAELKKFERCRLPMDQGNCSRNSSTHSVHHNYYFDSRSFKCLPFIYSGCDGNNNNFDTLSECHEACSGVRDDDTVLQDACLMPRDSGEGSGRFARFYYNAEQAECVPYNYLGSKGNLNKFNSEEECQQKCIASAESKSGYYVAEVVVGIVLVILLVIGSVVAWKYYKVYKSNENYRIFQNQQIQRQDSISPTLPQMHSAEAYVNPAFEGGADGNSFQMHENL